MRKRKIYEINEMLKCDVYSTLYSPCKFDSERQIYKLKNCANLKYMKYSNPKYTKPFTVPGT